MKCGSDEHTKPSPDNLTADHMTYIPGYTNLGTFQGLYYNLRYIECEVYDLELEDVFILEY